jgi:hypothetical protein
MVLELLGEVVAAGVPVEITVPDAELVLVPVTP